MVPILLAQPVPSLGSTRLWAKVLAGAYVQITDDFDKTFELQKKVLALVGIEMTHKVSKFKSKFWNFYYWFMTINIILVIFSELGAMARTIRNAQYFQDTVKVFQMMPCCGSCILSIIKTTKIKLNSNVFESMYYRLKAMWPRGELKDEERAIVNSAMKLINYVLKGYYWSNNILLLFYLSPPFFTCFGSYLGYDVDILLPFEYWLPFDPYQPALYEFMLVLQIWEGTVVILWNVAWDMLFCSYLLHITMQLDLVAVQVRKLVYVPSDKQLVLSYPLASISNEILKEEIERVDLYNNHDKERVNHKKLIDIVTKHQSLISLANDAEAMFSFALLINFMYSSIIICFCGFCCVLIEKWNEVAYKLYLLVTLAQTWLLCSYGQKLLDSSCRLSDALYETGWYNTSQNIKSSILIMMQRSQKAIHVTTYGFSVLSLSSYSTIIKTSWSYFTLLLNFYTGKIDKN